MTNPVILILIALAIEAGLVFANNTSSIKPFSETTQGNLKGVGIALDSFQCKDPNAPVCVVSVVSGSSKPDENGKRHPFIKEVVVENRSMRNISSLVLRAAITQATDRVTVLKRVELDPQVSDPEHKILLAGQRQTLMFSQLRIFDLVQDIPAEKAPSRQFTMIIGVSQVTFEDGSSWKEKVTEGSPPELSHNPKIDDGS